MNNKSSVEISESIRQFVEATVEEVALEGKPFDTQKKWLRIYCEAEGVDYEALENNLNDLFEALDDWKRLKSKTSQLAARMLAKKLCLSENMVAKLVDERTPQPLPGLTLDTKFVDPQLLMRDGQLVEVEIDGRLISPCGWRYACDFSEGLARVEADDGLKGYIDATGNIAIPCKWKRAGDFSEAFAPVKNEKGECFFIDKLGNVVIACGLGADLFDFCAGFHEGLAKVQINGKWGFLDKSGKVVIPCKWKYVSAFEDGLASVRDDYDKFGCINKEGELIIPCIYEEEMVFYEGLAYISRYWREGASYFIDKTGKKVLETFYVTYSGFKEGLASMEDVGFMDKTGEIVIEDKWSPEPMGFSEGLAPTEEGYIDHSGKVVIKNLWDDYREFREGLAVVSRDKRCGYIDHNGCEVVPCMWDSAGAFSGGLAYVRLAEMGYFINKQGKVLCKVKRNG